LLNTEDSGLSCNYYEILVKAPHLFEKTKIEYLAECGEIASALNLTIEESNIFKEIWRNANARQGKKKSGNTPIRAAEKIKFYSDRLYHKAKFQEDR